MKNVLMIFSMLLVSLFLVSCDYPEKDIHLLAEYEIPRAVTKDFVLPYGRLGPITYTSTHPDVLVITNLYEVEVIQQEEDIVVTLEARVKEAFKTFEIKVLKIGSDLTIKEQSDLMYEELKDLIPETINHEIELPSELNGIMLDYDFSLNGQYFRLVRKSDSTIWLVPNFDMTPTNKNTKIRVKVLNETKEYIPFYYIEVKYIYDYENLLEQEDIFLSLNLDFKYYQRGRATLFVNEGDTLDFSYISKEYERVNVSVRIDVGNKEDITIRDKVVYIKNIDKHKSYSLIVAIDIDGITQEFRVFIQEDNK